LLDSITNFIHLPLCPYFLCDASDNKSKHRGGLNFPGNKLPDYLDFAYFSFVIGMTFQVSDVSIVEQHFRRISLLHALLAFVFNTVIVALSINCNTGPV
jgi:uncharacterized membrane protein